MIFCEKNNENCLLLKKIFKMTTGLQYKIHFILAVFEQLYFKN